MSSRAPRRATSSSTSTRSRSSANRASISARSRSVGDTRRDTGVGPPSSACEASKGTYVRRHLHRYWDTTRAGPTSGLPALSRQRPKHEPKRCGSAPWRRGRLPFALEAEVAMKLRIFPRDESFFDLFEAAADNMAQSARLLDDLLGDFVDPELKAKRLVECEHQGDRITHAILTRLNSTFITPFDREDIYALAAQLDDVVDALEEAADMLVLHKVAEPIEPVREQARIILQAAEETARGLRHLRKLNLVRLRAYQVAVTELEEEGDRVYRRARAELYTFSGEHPARYVLVWKDIVEQLEEALDSLDHVTHTVEGIVLTYG